MQAPIKVGNNGGYKATSSEKEIPQQYLPTVAVQCGRFPIEHSPAMEQQRQQQSQQQQQQPTAKTKKRVEWSSNLSSTEAFVPEDRSPMWDSEVGHILSYFLGDSSAGQNGSPDATQPSSHATGTATENHHVSNHSSATSYHRGGNGILLNAPTPGFAGTYQRNGLADRDKHHDDDEDDDEPVPPPTPATQYYYPSQSSSRPSAPSVSSSFSSSSSSSSKHQAKSNNFSHPLPTSFPFPHPPPLQPPPPQHAPSIHHPSASDSVHTIKASLVSGPPRVAPPPPIPHQPTMTIRTPSMEQMSPISPAAMIGHAQEKLLLPPPRAENQQTQPLQPSDQPMAQQPAHASHSQHSGGTQSHLDWLSHINSIVKASNSQMDVVPHHQSVTHPHAPVHAHTVHNPHIPHNQHHSLMPPPQPRVPATTVGTSIPTHTTAAVPPAAATAIPVPPSIPGYPHHHPAVVGMPHAAIGAMNFYTHLTQIQQQSSSAVESEEKRARRLERNRESARRSRRRKKERLSHLEDKVSGLHTTIDTERRKQINAMCPMLLQNQREVTSSSSVSTDEEMIRRQLESCLQAFEVNSPVQRAVTDFQYTTLKQLLLPKYQKFALWLTLHGETYFTTGKEQHQNRDGKQVLRATSGKLSSKQVGDELTNGRKLEDGTVEAPPTAAASTTESGEKTNQQTANAFDAPRMWPLFCYEMSISVDQEDRFMQAHKRVLEKETLHLHRSQIEVASRVASNLREALLYQSHVMAIRDDKTYKTILTPQQSLRYKQWMSKNREKVSSTLAARRATGEQRNGSTSSSSGSTSSGRIDGANGPSRVSSSSSVDAKQSKEFAKSLDDICRKLEQVLQISKGEGPYR